MSGTSQATAFASGVAALIIDANMGKLPPHKIISKLHASRKLLKPLKNKTKFSGSLDVKKTLLFKDEGTSLEGGQTQHSEIMNGWFLTNNPDNMLE